ncbi:hypothetical protein Tco_1182628 [Tanacetum coccineum]
MTPEAIEELVNRRVEEALAAYEATRAANALEAESQSLKTSQRVDNGNGGNGNGGDGNGNSGDGNGGDGNGRNRKGGNENPNENNRGVRLGSVIAVEPTRLQDAVRIANNLMDQKLKGYAVKNAKNKRRQRHYRSNFPKLKDQNRGNKTGNKNGVGEARGKGENSKVIKAAKERIRS